MRKLNRKRNCVWVLLFNSTMKQRIFVNPVMTTILPSIPSSTHIFWFFEFISSLGHQFHRFDIGEMPVLRLQRHQSALHWHFNWQPFEQMEFSLWDRRLQQLLRNGIKWNFQQMLNLVTEMGNFGLNAMEMKIFEGIYQRLNWPLLAKTCNMTKNRSQNDREQSTNVHKE